VGTDANAQTRRNFVIAGAGALAAGLAGLLGRPLRVQAADPNDVVLGGINTTAAPTLIRSGTINISAVWAENTYTGTGASPGDGVGLRGTTGGVGGSDDRPAAGVWGEERNSVNDSRGAGVLGTTAQVSSGSQGVLGVATNANGIAVGVRGRTRGMYGNGVEGFAVAGSGVSGYSDSGTGLYGHANTGLALRTDGRLRFQRISGVATIAAGAKTITVTPGVNVGTTDFVLLTPKVNLAGRSLWFTVDAATDTFVIRMNQTRTSDTPVAWLLAAP